MDIPYSGFREGQVIALGVKIEDSGTRYIAHTWLILQNGEEVMDGSCGSAILDEENKAVGFFRYTPLAISPAGLLPAGVYYFQVPRPLGTCRFAKNFSIVLYLNLKEMFQAQISPGCIQLCLALPIGLFLTTTYPGCGRHNFHH